MHEILLTLIKSEANANPNRNDIAAHCGQNGYKEVDRKTSVREEVERREASCTAGGSVNGSSQRPSGEERPQKFKNPCPIGSSYSSGACLAKELGNTTA